MVNSLHNVIYKVYTIVIPDPVFCRAVETVDGARVGCSHAARRERDGSVAAMLRAGPRSPYVLLCMLHTKLLAKHMGCPTCGMFCTQVRNLFNTIKS